MKLIVFQGYQGIFSVHRHFEKESEAGCTKEQERAYMNREKDYRKKGITLSSKQKRKERQHHERRPQLVTTFQASMSIVTCQSHCHCSVAGALPEASPCLREKTNFLKINVPRNPKQFTKPLLLFAPNVRREDVLLVFSLFLFFHHLCF